MLCKCYKYTVQGTGTNPVLYHYFEDSFVWRNLYRELIMLLSKHCCVVQEASDTSIFQIQ